MICQEEPLLAQITRLYEEISRLDSLKPSKDVNTLFTQLVLTCMPHSAIDVTKLCKRVQEMRSKLIRLCGEAEGLLESHFSTLLGSFENPLHHLHLFPYFNNYLKLSQLEFSILTQHSVRVPVRVAFVGAGPLPLTSIVLATYHLTESFFHNYDIDASANSMASRLVSSAPDLSRRMSFHTSDIMKVTDELKAYDVVFLAALVGMDKEEKVRVIDHLARYMDPGAILMLRSAHGARAFLYPVVDPVDLRGFEVLSVFHPTDEVINSVLIARRVSTPVCTQLFLHSDLASMRLQPSCKCSDFQALNPLNHGSMIEELAINENKY
ncbi:hypothetical protein Nepgr_001618 [Nepenthes gracilis]|uniref:Nicotianamine synthase n=1 Tax=Nepenthes gracilis TaxID=150966 RepID=A0AAD3RX53_NEPGR|nr:hypothetical protein Nepgr_001618 [Nepenthes gracilis]